MTMRYVNGAIDVFLIYWLFVASSALLPLLVLGSTERDLAPEGAAFLRLLILPALVMMPLLVLSRYRDMLTLLLGNPFLILLLIWIWCSVTWSIAPDITIRRALGLTTYTLLACYLALRHDHRWIIKVLAWMALLVLALSVVFMVVLPNYGLMYDGRGVRGVFTHKNGMGGFAVLSIAVFMSTFKDKLIPKGAALIGLVISVALLPLINSATATVVALALFAVFGTWWLLTYSLRAAIIVGLLGFAATLLLGLLAFIYLDEIFALLGRDLTFTGRTGVWSYVWEMIRQRWLYGYGYEAFWQIEANTRYAADSLQWDVPNSHSGFLETFLGLGAVGLGLFLALVATMIYRIVHALGQAEAQPAGLLLVLLSAYLMRGSLEANFLGQNSIMWVLLITLSVALTPGLKRGEDERPAGPDQPRTGLDPAPIPAWKSA